MIGMSADEYSGWSFYYWENCNVRENGKVVKYSSRILTATINIRTNWYGTAWLNDIVNGDRYIFTADWYVESVNTYRGMWYSDVVWGALYKRSTWWYLNAVKIGTTYLWISTTKIDRFIGLPNIFGSTQNVYDTNKIVNYNLTSDTWWTVWAWWTTWADWATHTTWTDVLEQTINTPDWTKKIRIAVMVTNHTVGTVQVRLRAWWSNAIAWTISTTSDMWSVFYIYNATATWTDINFNPSNDFNGTISAVMLSPYDDNWLKEDEMTITSASKHPAIYSQWNLYIWSWAVIDVIETSLWDVTSINIIDSDYTIVWFTEVWSQILIRANNGQHSKQYFWDGVSDVPNEIVTHKGVIITWIDSDWVNNYAITQAGNDRKLWIVSWYNKTLIASSVNTNGYGYWADTKAYKMLTRNDFDCTYSNIICYDGKVAIPSYKWVYTYWYENPWQSNSLIKSWGIWDWVIYSLWYLPWSWLCISYNNR